jgi:hypothetical protein
VLGHEEKRFLGGLPGFCEAVLSGGEKRLETSEYAVITGFGVGR